MSSPSFTVSFLSFFIFSLTFSSIAQAIVPENQTFHFVNEGEFGPYIVEYDGNYRMLSIFSSPFQLGFYNTTPNAYTLALRMGLTRSESLFRWVWEANRGNPVGENATFSFQSDGNLVLAHADGRVAWQTGTANKGVVAFELLPTGNMVLLDSAGKYVWQSFDSPTDTLLVGQSLRVGAATKLISRASDQQNVNGPYSFEMEPKRFAMYYKTNNTPKPYLYFASVDWLDTLTQGSLQNVTLVTSPDTDEGFAYNIILDIHVVNSTVTTGVNRILTRPKYNATLSFLRIGMDGNLRVYTYYDNVDWRAFEVTYTLFAREESGECQLPERCGKFGICEDSQCVACPLKTGLMGWSKDCAPEKLSSCKKNSFHYNKVTGVDHFLAKYTRGDGAKESDCGNKCTGDCKCLGYFYHQDTSRCWIAYDLKTLTRVANSTHVAYIKVSN